MAKVEEPTEEPIIEVSEPQAAAPKRVWRWALAHKKYSIPLTIGVLLGLLTAIPQTRYILPSLVVKKDVQFIVQDTSGLNRISDADVTIDGKLLTSDANGVVKANGIRPGKKQITVNKLFYKTLTTTATISLFSNKQGVLNLTSTGRPAKVTVKNRFNGQALAGVTVKTEKGSQDKTDAKGVAILVLPSNASSVKATISGDTITTTEVTVRAVQDDTTNVYPVTPKGRIYFLSKASGKIDVVKTNLDGTDRQTVLAGTGKESDSGTILLASKDWKYLALKSHRDGELEKLYLIDTSDDSLTTMDEGNASFSMVGWDGDRFVYLVSRTVRNWQPKAQALKSYHAPTKQITLLDETRAEGTNDYDYAYEYISSVFTLRDQIVYTKTWYASYYYGTHFDGKTLSVQAIKADKSGKKTLKEWPAGYYTYMSTIYSDINELYFFLTQEGGVRSFWQYQNGKVEASSELTTEDFNKTYPIYFESPNAKSSLWAEARDGKNSVFVGDENGKNSKEVATLSEYTPYGWYTDDYVLVSKKGSELYIMGRDGIKPGDVPTKVSDYHKPEYQYFGYGKGYGGI